ncbi:MAG: MerR family DNA-binding transcriptional regulator [Actinophytocola sp.]|uniref:transcriptional regulator FtsR n=1 Tax=Actinophytocola sp. TaxID=1872138 RepID=UPI00132C6601|nr:MerR family transcriptional regulator [Actinophytocola sp.]MPZ84914.1 MerR family DNA-binding transcriptional regulator [Actinophytocola sp.]
MTAAGRPSGEGLSIGAVLSRLRSEFPDVTISKIRFLESEGLIQPARTASGYRRFTPADVARLRFVLAAQRDHYLPLKVIKEQLDAADRGESDQHAPGSATRPPRGLMSVPANGLPSAREFAEEPLRRLTKEDLLEQAGIDAAALGELEQYGLVRPGAAGFYDTDSAMVARMVRSMAEFGIEPRHLRAFRASADREVGLLEQIVAPMYRQHGEDARGRADEAMRELAALSVGLHTLLVKAGLRQISGR